MNGNVINKMQNTPSAIPNWPDLIDCGTDSFGKALFLVHNEKETDNLARYVQPYSTEHRMIRFSLDGTYTSMSIVSKGTKGCLGKSIQQLYDQGRAFNFVNDPEQKEKIQKLEEENNLLKTQIEKITEESNSRFKLLENTIKQLQEGFVTLQKNIPKEITSDDCFMIFKAKDIKVCIVNTNTRINILEPSFTIAKSNSCIEGDIFDICIEQFELRGIVPCNDEEYGF